MWIQSKPFGRILRNYLLRPCFSLILESRDWIFKLKRWWWSRWSSPHTTIHRPRQKRWCCRRHDGHAEERPLCCAMPCVVVWNRNFRSFLILGVSPYSRKPPHSPDFPTKKRKTLPWAPSFFSLHLNQDSGVHHSLQILFAQRHLT